MPTYEANVTTEGHTSAKVDILPDNTIQTVASVTPITLRVESDPGLLRADPSWPHVRPTIAFSHRHSVSNNVRANVYSSCSSVSSGESSRPRARARSTARRASGACTERPAPTRSGATGKVGFRILLFEYYLHQLGQLSISHHCVIRWEHSPFLSQLNLPFYLLILWFRIILHPTEPILTICLLLPICYT